MAHAPARKPSFVPWCLFASLAIAITALDLWTKENVFRWLDVRSEGRPPVIVSQRTIVVVDGLFELEATFNRGAFSGWFREHTGVLTLLSATAVVAIVCILAYVLRRQAPRPSLWFVGALGAICGGTAGNLYDRFYLEAVRDWIKWFAVIGGRQWVWPNFNIADSAICVGVALILILEVTRTRRSERAARVGCGGTSGRASDDGDQGSAAASRRS